MGWIFTLICKHSTSCFSDVRIGEMTCGVSFYRRGQGEKETKQGHERDFEDEMNCPCALADCFSYFQCISIFFYLIHQEHSFTFLTGLWRTSWQSCFLLSLQNKIVLICVMCAVREATPLARLRTILYEGCYSDGGEISCITCLSVFICNLLHWESSITFTQTYLNTRSEKQAVFYPKIKRKKNKNFERK